MKKRKSLFILTVSLIFTLLFSGIAYGGEVAITNGDIIQPEIHNYLSDIIQPVAGDELSSDYFEINPFNPYINISGKTYSKGYRIKVFYKGSSLLYLNNKFNRITGLIGIDDKSEHKTIDIEILGDGNRIFSTTLNQGDYPEKLDLNVTGIKILTIKASNGSIGLGATYIDFANTVVDENFVLESLTDSKLDNISGKYMSDLLIPYYINNQFYDSYNKTWNDWLLYSRWWSNYSMKMNGIEYYKGYKIYPYKYSLSDYRTLTYFNLNGKVKSIKCLIGRDESSDNGLEDNTIVEFWGNNESDKNWTKISELSIEPGFNPIDLNLNVAGIEHFCIILTSQKDGQIIDFANVKCE